LKLFKGKEDVDFIITKASDGDISFCVDRMTRAIGNQPVNREVLEQTLKTPNVIVLVAKVKEKVVGAITGLAFPSLIPPPRIDFLDVSDEESAKKGLPYRLIDGFIEELKKRVPNATYVDTNVSASNPNYVAMYSLKGFLVTGFTRGEKPIGDTIVLRKNISSEASTSYTV
jgi:hypothetical protein